MSTRQSSWDNPNSFIGCIDRSPCGTGTSARLATMYARGEVGIGEDFRPESVTGTVFTGRILDKVKLGDVDAIVPQITGFANYVRAPTDPFPTGFTVADIRIRLASRRP